MRKLLPCDPKANLRLVVNQSARRFLFALLFAVVIYGGFVAISGYQTLKSALSGFRWWTLGAALGLTSINYVLRYLKWEFYLGRLGIDRVPKGDSMLIFLSGFVLTVTPGKLGEVFKSAILAETYAVDAARTAPIIIAERLTDVIAIVALIAVGSAGLEGGWFWAGTGGFAVALGMLLILWPRPIRSLIAALAGRQGWGARLAPRLETAHASLMIVASPGALVLPTTLSILGWGLEGVGLWMLLGGFEQVAPVLLSTFIYATATLAGALVPLPGGLGVAEAMFQTQMVELAGVELGAATASMLLIRFATLWWAVIVGFIALWILRRRFPGLLRENGSA